MVNSNVFKMLVTTLALIHDENDFRFLNTLFDEFKLNKKQYTSIRYEFKPELYVLAFKDDFVGPFDQVPVLHFYYDVVTDICNQPDYMKRIIAIVDKILPEDFTPSLKNRDVNNALYSIKQLESHLPFVIPSDCDIEKSLENILSERLDTPNIEENKIYQKYVKKQMEKIYAKLSHGKEFNEKALYLTIAGMVDECLIRRSFSTDIVVSNFGFLFGRGEVNCEKRELGVVERIVKSEINRYLLDEILSGIKDSTYIGITQIIRQAGVKEEEVSGVINLILKSCEEYFCLRELSNLLRKQVYKDIFGNKNTVVKEVLQPVISKESEDLQQKNEELISENEKLKASIEKLRAELDTYKSKEVSKQKELEIVLREKDLEIEKLKNQTEKQHENFKKTFKMWGSYTSILIDVLDSVDNDDILLMPYNMDYLTSKKILFIGGRTETIRKLKEVFPSSSFIDNENRAIPTGNFDCIFFFTDFMNHGMFFKYIPVARERKIPAGYSRSSSNFDIIYSDLYQTLRRIKEINIE